MAQSRRENPNHGSVALAASLAKRNIMQSGGMVEWIDVPPETSNAAGQPGQCARDDSYLYVCTTPDTWKRVQLTSW